MRGGISIVQVGCVNALVKDVNVIVISNSFNKNCISIGGGRR